MLSVSDLMYLAIGEGTQLSVTAPLAPVVPIGPVNTDGYLDLAISETGELYGTRHGVGSSYLYEIDPITGIATQVSAISNKWNVNALEFVYGTLYGASGDNGELLRWVSGDTWEHVMWLGSSQGDLAYQESTGRLYFVDQFDHLCWLTLGEDVTYDVGAIGYSNVFAMDFAGDGNLYAVSSPSGSNPSLLQLNLSTGHGTVKQTYADPGQVWGMTSIEVTSGVEVIPSGGLQTSESGGTDTLQISLSSQPLAAVTIGLSSSDTGEGIVSPDGMVFTPDNWSTPRTATVTGVDDAVGDGAVDYRIVLGNTVSADPRYNNLPLPAVDVTNIDDEPPAVQFHAAAQSGSEGAGTMVVSVQLTSLAAVDVVVPFSLSGTATAGSDYTITASPIVIPAGFPNGEIWITAVDDGLYESAETVVVTLGTPSGATLGSITRHTATIVDNDAAPVVRFESSSQSRWEAGGLMTVRVLLSQAAGSAVSVPYTVSGTATGDNWDYLMPESPLVISAGQLSAELTIGLVNDGLDEDDETIVITLGAPDGAQLGAPATHTVTIIDDDPLPTVQLLTGGQTQSEGAGALSITLQMSGASGREVRVPFTVEGSATAGSDYAVPANPVVIPAGQTTGTIVLDLIDDPNDEPQETIVVRLGAPTNAELGVLLVHTATLTDNDWPPMVDFIAEGQAVSETSVATTVGIVLSEASAFPITVPISVMNGTAQPDGVDFRVSTSAITIPAGQVTGSVPVELIDDFIDEPDETFIVRIGAPVNAMQGTLIEHTITITDNDLPPTVQFSLAGQTVVEGLGGATIAVELSEVSGFEVTLPFTTGGNAARDTDYTIDFSPLVIPAGQRTATINVAVSDDLLYEGEESVVVTLDNAINATPVGTTTHTLIIGDNDPPPIVQWSLESQVADEGQGSITITATLSDASGLPATLPIALGGTAAAGADFSIAPNPIVILPGEWSGSTTITLLDDGLHEAEETLTLTLANSVNAIPGFPATHTLRIIDDDPPPVVEFVTAGQSVSESVGTVTVTAGLSAVSGLPVVVPYTLSGTADGGDDYTLGPNPLVIPAGQMTASISIELVKDLIDEPDETVVLALGAPTGATLGAATMHTVTVHNAPTARFNLASQAAAEDGGLVTLVVELSTASVLPVTLPLAASGTAVAGLDYTIGPNPVVIPAGLTSATIEIQVSEDALYEGNETAVIALGAPQGAVLGAPSSHSLSIIDNDPPPVVQFALVAQSTAESAGALTISALLSTVSGLPVTLPFTLSGTAVAGADYSIAPNPLVIPAGQTSGAVTLDLVKDLIDEGDETVILTLGTPTYATLGIVNTHTVTVHNAPVVEWTTQAEERSEAGGTITLTARLSTPSVLPVILPFAFSGTATAGTDYAISASPLTIPAGQTTGSVTITLTNDALDEDDETLFVSLESPTNAILGTETTWTATITDDDPTPSVAFATGTDTVAESGAGVVVEVRLSAISGRSVTVPFTVTGTATNGSDYTISAGPLLIPAGQASATITITPIDDALDELDETITLTLGEPTNAVLGGPALRSLSIADDDPAPTVQFELSDQAAGELAGTMTVTVRLSAVSSLGVLVPFSVSGTARPGADFAITASPIMILPGEDSATITIDLVDDGRSEPDETVILTLQTPTYATLGATARHTATILGDGPVPATTIGLFAPSASVFYLSDSNLSPAADHMFGYGEPGAGWQVLVGDWDGDGAKGVGLFSPESSIFFLTSSLAGGYAEYTFGYGEAGGGWIPLVGDWDGDGADGVGLYDPESSLFYLTNTLESGYAEYMFGYGEAGGGWIPLVGDWDGDGADGVGLYDPEFSLFYLTSTLAGGYAEEMFGYGEPGGGWQPIVGDWDGDGATGVGLFAPQISNFFLTNAFVSGYAQYTFGYGDPGAGWKPLVGDWDGDSSAGVGLYDPAGSIFYLTDTLQTGIAEYAVGFGPAGGGWQPLVGNWPPAGPGGAALDAKSVDQLDLAALAAEVLDPLSTEYSYSRP